VKVSFEMGSIKKLLKPVKFEIPTKSTYFKSEKLSPVNMFKHIIDRTNFNMKSIGFDIFTPGYTLFNRRFLWAFGNCLVFIAIHIYDIFIFRADLVRVCFLLGSLGFALQGLMKVKTFLLPRSKIVDLKDRCENFLSNVVKTKETNQIFESSMMICCHIGVSLIALYIVSIVLFLIYPIIFYLIFGEKILHAGYELPFIDWHTSSIGYAANFLYVILLAYLVLFVFVGTLFINILFVIMAFGQFELLDMMLKDLNEMIKSNKNGSMDEKIKHQIKLIVEIHNELLK
jgi:hypothetical protein